MVPISIPIINNFTIFYMLILNNKIPNQDKVKLAELFVKYGADVNLVKKQDDFSKEIMNSQRYKERKENIVKLLKVFLKYNDLGD